MQEDSIFHKLPEDFQWQGSASFTGIKGKVVIKRGCILLKVYLPKHIYQKLDTQISRMSEGPDKKNDKIYFDNGTAFNLTGCDSSFTTRF